MKPFLSYDFWGVAFGCYAEPQTKAENVSRPNFGMPGSMWACHIDDFSASETNMNSNIQLIFESERGMEQMNTTGSFFQSRSVSVRAHNKTSLLAKRGVWPNTQFNVHLDYISVAALPRFVLRAQITKSKNLKWMMEIPHQQVSVQPCEAIWCLQLRRIGNLNCCWPYTFN